MLSLQNATSHLLGVVGVDVPVRELERLASPFQLGVNAYPLILNKNGHLISHPDLRPMVGSLRHYFHRIYEFFMTSGLIAVYRCFTIIIVSFL